MRKFILFLGVLLFSMTVGAQTYKLSDKDQKLLSQAAVDKVERFQTNCRYIADVNLSNTQKQNAIRTAMTDFMKGSKIVTTSLSGAKQKPKLVKTYLQRLAYNLPDVYAFIDITWTDCHVASDFTKHPDKPNTYIGIVKVIQYFNAMTKEMKWKGDITEREIKIEAELTEIFANNTTRRQWSVKLGDVEGKAVQ